MPRSLENASIDDSSSYFSTEQSQSPPPEVSTKSSCIKSSDTLIGTTLLNGDESNGVVSNKTETNAGDNTRRKLGEEPIKIDKNGDRVNDQFEEIDISNIKPSESELPSAHVLSEAEIEDEESINLNLEIIDGEEGSECSQDTIETKQHEAMIECENQNVGDSITGPEEVTDDTSATVDGLMITDGPLLSGASILENSPPKNKPNKDGSLLRLFQSELFDSYFHMYYLHHRHEPGIHDYLVNLLYRRSEEDIHFYLPQLCCLCLARYKTSNLDRFVLEKASKSMHLALKSSWLFQASICECPPETNEHATQLTQEIEMAIVNSKPVPPGSAAYTPSLEASIPDLFERRKAVSKLKTTHNLARRTIQGCSVAPKQIGISEGPSDGCQSEDKRRMPSATIVNRKTSVPREKPVNLESGEHENLEQSIEKSSSADCDQEKGGKQEQSKASSSNAAPQGSSSIQPPPLKQRVAKGFVQRVGQISHSGSRVTLPSVYDKLGSPFRYSSFKDTALMDAEMQQFIVKQRRCDYFNLLNSFTSMIIEVSHKLALEPDRTLRLPLLRSFLEALNEWMFCRRCIVAACEGTFAMTGLNIPLSEFGSLNPVGSNTHSTQIVRFIPDECRVLSSKKRAPYLLVFEVADLDEDLRQLPSIFRLTTAEFSKAILRNVPFHLDEAAARELVKRCSTEEVEETKDVTHAPPLWNHLYVYNCILKELAERRLYKPPENVVDSNALIKPFPSITDESPLGALQRSMGLKPRRMSNRRQIEVKLPLVQTENRLIEVPQILTHFDTALPQSVEAPRATESMAISDPESSTVLRSIEGGQPQMKDPAMTLEPEVSKPPTIEDSEASDKSGDGSVQGSMPRLHISHSHGFSPSSPALLQSPDDINSSVTKSSTVRSVTSLPLVNSLNATLASTTHSMIQLHAPVALPAGQSRRKSFQGGINLSGSPGPKPPSEAPASSTKGHFSSITSPSYINFSSVWELATGVISSTRPKEVSKEASRKESQGSPLSDTHSPLPSSSHQPSTAETKAYRSSSTTALGSTGSESMDDSVGGRSEGGENGPLNTAAELAANARRLRTRLWGTLWRDNKQRYRQSSPYGSLKSWNLGCVLVKGGDDVRQEMLASQLMRQFKWIFEEARLPLYLRPYEILVTGANSGVMVFVPDTISIDYLKKNFGTDSIAKVFEAAFADNPYEAKKNFIESHAAYSIVAYLLQVKDRHNANFLLDAEGHVIHIDYGFMLSNSPGNVNFESSPFKLTSEFVDVMDGELSDNFEYFRTLVVRGFLEARKHAERLFLLLEMMLTSSKMPCFVAGAETTFIGFRDRFMMNLTEEMCIQRIVDLIDASVNNWRTIQYDNFQRITNGIL